MITLESSDVFMVVFSDEHVQLPPRHHRCGWEPLLHRPASPGFSASAVRRTPPAQLRRRRFCHSWHREIVKSFLLYDPWWLAKPKMSAGGLRLSDVKSYSVLTIFIANLL
jgi:hypothetical protein